MSGNDHGWADLGYITASGGVRIEFAPVVEPRHRCGCRTWWPGCQRSATQEDLRCDECRETCPPVQSDGSQT